MVVTEAGPAAIPSWGVKGFARRMGVHPATVRRWIRRGLVHPWRVGGRWRFGMVHVVEVTRRETGGPDEIASPVGG